MQLKQLIQQLQEIYNKEVESIDILGEPTIEIDHFEKVTYGENRPPLFMYKGFSGDISIEQSPDGVYHILSRFSK